MTVLEQVVAGRERGIVYATGWVLLLVYLAAF